MRPKVEPTRVVHRDRHLLVLYKPTGIPTTAPDDGPCLVREAERLDPDASRLHPSSRLDAEVSGLVTFARTKRGTHALIEARRDGAYGRRYLGITLEQPGFAARCGRWTASIGIDPADPRRRLADSGRAQKEAETVFRPRSLIDSGGLLDLWPITGRTHQLRVHAAHAGLPLFGDVHYGGERRVTQPNGRVVTASRAMLHCVALELRHPVLGELRLCSPPPADFRRCWDRLGGEPQALEVHDVALPDVALPAGTAEGTHSSEG